MADGKKPIDEKDFEIKSSMISREILKADKQHIDNIRKNVNGYDKYYQFSSDSQRDAEKKYLNNLRGTLSKSNDIIVHSEKNTGKALNNRVHISAKHGDNFIDCVDEAVNQGMLKMTLHGKSRAFNPQTASSHEYDKPFEVCINKSLIELKADEAEAMEDVKKYNNKLSK